MQASGINIEFPAINSKAFDVSGLSLGLGQLIIMSVPSLPKDTRWFFDNDSVLDVAVTENQATIKALEVGTSTILLQDSAFNLLKKFIIEVVDEPAVTLGLSAGNAVPK
jgi:hypothetical protein